MQLPQIIIQQQKERSIQRLHPWIFSGAIKSISGNPVEGDLVQVLSVSKKFLAIGIYGTGSIAVRILTFEEEPIDRNFWVKKLANAFQLRKSLGLTKNNNTNIYRLVHAEGDQLPGLIVDVYGKVAILQAHQTGIHRFKQLISEVLIEISEGEIHSVFDKSSETLPQALAEGNSFIIKSEDANDIPKENGLSFNVDWQTGQKTGFFIDQRDNRKLLGEMCKGKKVLNTFCYTGGFSVYALHGGAELVYSIDSSQSAIDMCNSNIATLDLQPERHKAIKADAVQYIKDLAIDFDIIVLDPPAFAKHVRTRHNAIQAYKRLNAHAIRQIKPGGVIFTFSCSQVVDKEIFKSTILAAAIECKRSVRILYQLHQPADHPINIFHPESEYLKGLVIQVD